ncbi:monooxygenase 2-like [Ipomoea triloba]|uniref:monooxygenase 2-like n=1 Tax=Ipomoea triloba TaxID=35885 RepID=UPI00125E9D50|nr:monooxygenase 2-like [Ipomoea triloba]
MEMREDIVIVGAGIAGLATALGLHRQGLRSMVLESSESLRAAGFALGLWTNAWRALDALAIGDSLRQQSVQNNEFQVFSADSGLPTAAIPLQMHKNQHFESRCMRRKVLLETLHKELPEGTIRYSSKVVMIEESGLFKLVHLADGSIIRTKVVIGCDGVNSVVAKWLGLQNAVDSKRSAIRGFVECPEKHGYEPKFYAFFGGGVRFGFLPCDETGLYWFCTYNESTAHFDESAEQDPVKLKEFVLSKTRDVSKEVTGILERTPLDCISSAKLKLRLPWNILLGDITRSNICVAGDALHPMTPDLAQGGCSALEDSIILSRCLAEAFLAKPRGDIADDQKASEEFNRIKNSLDKYAKERRWRSFVLITGAYLTGFIQESNNKVISFLREKFLARYTLRIVLSAADFDCGKLLLS